MFSGCPCIRVFMVMRVLKVCECINLTEEFHQIYNLDAVADENGLIAFWGQKVRAEGHDETKMVRIAHSKIAAFSEGRWFAVGDHLQFVQKKSTGMFFFVISSIKLRRFWWNLMQNDINIFHFTWIMSLHYLVKLEMLIRHVLSVVTEWLIVFHRFVCWLVCLSVTGISEEVMDDFCG